jgi:hypothetical protein
MIGLDQDMVDEMMNNYVGEKKASKSNNRRKRRR